jgi:hypothetical protein
LVAVPPASVRYSMKLQVRPSYESPSQTNPYLVWPLASTALASVSSCSQVVGTASPSLAEQVLAVVQEALVLEQRRAVDRALVVAPATSPGANLLQ